MDVPRALDDSQKVIINSKIDEWLKQERDAIRKRKAAKPEVKVMLLGQAESGKSTLQKQFQLHYAAKTIDTERPSWTPIVYFNIIKAVRVIIEELDYEFMSDVSHPSPAPSPPSTAGSDWRIGLAELRAQLLPLVAIEDALASELSGGITVSGGRSGVYVRSGWQALVTPKNSWPLADIRNNANIPAVTNLAARTLMETAYAIQDLWQHPAVRILIRRRKLRLDESGTFFLENIHRIAAPDYLPTLDDILHVRLQTLGVVEHAYDVRVNGVTYNWLMYDVGGARGQRHAWVPYFDDATAIIFLAPISAFDQYLEEDPKTNRIDDSLQLFKTIVQNKLLKKASLVLMLNKTDLLKEKLEAGTEVRKFITSFGDRPNTYEEVSEYFRAHFIQAHRREDISQPRRPLYVHFTSMIDVKTTQTIITHVGEAIIRSYISEAGLLT
ncbi:G-alpha-domain-containing protein [Gloeophyllum trabeum ATCC 11539]|uniref:G-alpha-domain-containing protein n=1 Tax=Gloeophyllum trabeum (strain ATCC 11539 / FP-39264 / Madison 617) TaxID=670483 RepID=S7QAF3_GLOTA|nr:G-alpha-domain-containing protein [Gloeophyllum trabeum ATCC 11539]EPQ56896.1 G-alpha-domain-containing protein [Gloeophyllum trabeum ATCC 11539]